MGAVQVLGAGAQEVDQDFDRAHCSTFTSSDVILKPEAIKNSTMISARTCGLRTSTGLASESKRFASASTAVISLPFIGLRRRRKAGAGLQQGGASPALPHRNPFIKIA